MNQILNESCETGLRKLPERSIDCCVTSPPYYAMRDYGCDGQIGLEETPEKYIERLVGVFREVRRVLRDDGTLWVNIADSYWGGGWRGAELSAHSGEMQKHSKGTHCGESLPMLKGVTNGIKNKDLIGIPWMLAFALRADGWYLRQEIIWSKGEACMPESVTDRCTKSHESIFLLSKCPKYYFDADAIKEKASTYDESVRDRDNTKLNNTPGRSRMAGLTKNNYEMRNKRDVWVVHTKPLKEAHFATYPEKLIEPCIKAGSRLGGLVLDPFMGSGTTAVVARKLDRNYVGFELNPEYIKIAEKRLNNELGLFL